MKAETVCSFLKKNKRFLISSHQNIDGDGLGSMLATRNLLRAMGKETCMVYDGNIPYYYLFLPGVEDIASYEEYERSSSGFHWDVCVVVDCSNPERLGRTDRLRLEIANVVNIDHHPDNSNYGTLNYVDYTCPSSSLMVYRLVKESAVPIDYALATQVMTGFITDTGGFQFVELESGLLSLMSELVEAGASISTIMRYVFKYRRFEALKLLGRALLHLEYDARHGYAFTYLTRQDFHECNSLEEDVEGIVDYGLHISEAEMSVFLKEMEPGLFKVSLRSQGRINILPIAHHFGGGGHFKAAGFTLPGDLQQATSRVKTFLKHFFEADNSYLLLRSETYPMTE